MLTGVLLGLAMVAGSVGDAGRTAEGAGADLSAYKEARKAAGRDAAAQVRLALWCEAHGLNAERVKHLALAVLSDPANPPARGLMGLVAYGGKWERPDEVARQVQDDPRRRALMQEYLARRARTSDKAEDQWRLAAWCEQNGLKDQAIAQYHAVLRRDPTREAAWKRLGYKKVGRQWVKPEWQAAKKQEAEEQSRANKRWKPLLEKWGAALSSRDKPRRAEAEKGLATVSDPRAVPAVWTVFALGGLGYPRISVRLLGQIDSPGSSRALAVLALRSPAAEVRQEATQTLRHRDPRDFTPMLVGLLRDAIAFEVRPVNGPGSTGELLIKNKEGHVRRLYSPPPPPEVEWFPNDSVSLDAAGLPVITRYVGQYQTNPVPVPGNNMALAASMFGLNPPNHAADVVGKLGLPPAIGQKLVSALGSRPQPQVLNLGGDPTRPLLASETVAEWARIPVGQMMLESQKAAQFAGKQLEADVQALKEYNAAVQDANRRVRQVLAGAIGSDLGAERTAWEKWMVDLFGYAYVAPASPSYQPPTYVEQVPLAYLPQPVPVMIFDQATGVVVQRQHSCFGAGTPVQTLDGPRPIEEIRSGDQVLTQDVNRGELKYRPVVTAFHNPPNQTVRIELEGESIVATGIHRLWKAGLGWTMARDLQAGDRLRTLGGLAVVRSVEADRVQPVYNLQVAEGESFFVGRSGVLAHDNSTIEPTPEPFDAVPALDKPAGAPAAGR